MVHMHHQQRESDGEIFLTEDGSVKSPWNSSELSMKPLFVFPRVDPEVLVDMVAKDRCHP